MNYPPQGPVDPAFDYPGYHGSGPRRPTWLWIALAVAVAIIVVLSAVVISQLKDDESDLPPTAATQTSVPLSVPTQPVPQPVPNQQQPPGGGSPTMTCEGYTASIDASSQPGWHAAVNRLGLAYAAPPDWTVAACGVRTGWAKPCPQGQCVVRELGAVASVPNPSCTQQNLAIAGVTQSNNPDIRAALDEEKKTVPLIYTQGGAVPKVEFSSVQEFTIGPHRAVQMVATVTGIATDACNGPSALHSMVVTTVPKVEGAVVFIISLRESAKMSPKPAVINEMVKTLRSPA